MSDEIKQAIWSVAKRFLRAFVAGGLSQVVVVATANGVKSVEELETWILALVVAFIVGGLMALDKAVRFQS